jgi:hypothetical protein
MTTDFSGQQKETLFYPLIFPLAGSTSCAPHPIEKITSGIEKITSGGLPLSTRINSVQNTDYHVVYY